jgi:hypothetical protein
VIAGQQSAQTHQLTPVHHLWQYRDLEERKRTREQTWSVSTWADTVKEVSQSPTELTLTNNSRRSSSPRR